MTQSVAGMKLSSVEGVSEDRIHRKQQKITDNAAHPLQTLDKLKSSFSNRLSIYLEYLSIVMCSNAFKLS